MRRMYLPGISVPGAQRVHDGDGVPLFTKRGKPVWEMPRPTSMVMHDSVVRVGAKTKRMKTEVPVYRGFDASLVRAVKAGLRRQRIKDAEKQATDAIKVEIPDDLIEEVTE